MGNLCIPDTGFDSLELTISPPAPHRPRDLQKQTSLSQDAPHIMGSAIDDDPRRKQKQREDGLIRLMSAFRLSDMTILSNIAGSDYSKLNRQEFKQVVVPPSSARLTVIDRMQTEGVVPQQIFVIAITQSQFKGLKSFRLPLNYKRALSLE